MFVHEPSRSICLSVDDPFMLRSLLLKSTTMSGEYNFAAKHTIKSTRVLRNLGYDVPSPIRYQYRWPGKYKPYAHQVEMAEFWTLNKRGFNLSEPGTMKTAAALWAADYLMTLKVVRKVLILAPLSTLDAVWKQDIFDTLMHRRAVVVHGDRAKRRAVLAQRHDFYILNHDGLKIKEIARIIKDDPEFDLIIVDEGDEFRNADTDKYAALEELIRPDMRLWWQTGTPCPNEPPDAWAQARLVNPRTVPKYFGAFKRETMMQITPFKWVPKKGAHEMAYAALQPGIRFKKSDCIELPEKVTVRRQAALTRQQVSVYNDMKEEMEMETAGITITAVHAADKILKLRQILCGVVRHKETGDYISVPHQPRVKLLLECIAHAQAKVIVIVPFKGIIKDLAAQISASYSVGVLNGDVSAGARRQIIYDFKSTPHPHVLLCHPKVMSHGLNLTEADTTIFYAPVHSNSQNQQVIERFDRAGQTRKMTIVRIAAHPLEWEIYTRSDVATTTQMNMLDLYRNFA